MMITANYRNRELSCREAGFPGSAKNEIEIVERV